MNTRSVSMLIAVLLLPAAASAELRIGSHAEQEEHPTTADHAARIKADLEIISGSTVTLTHHAAVSPAHEYWVATLGTAGTKPVGYALVHALVQSPLRITIVADSKKASMGPQGGGGITYCTNATAPDTIVLLPLAACRTGGTGTGSIVAISPPSAASDMSDKKNPHYIVLGHELTHAWHNSIGKRVMGLPNESQTIGTYTGYSGTAPAVVTGAAGLHVTENLMRAEHTLNHRNPANGTIL